MAWSAPMTAVAGSVFTAAQFNTFVRDNLNECPAAKAANPGGFFVTSATNEVVERMPAVDRVDVSETTTSTSFADLTTVGPSVTVTTGSMAVVALTARTNNNTATQPCLVGFDISGATTLAAADARALWQETNGVGEFNRSTAFHLLTTLSAGSNTFVAKYRVGGGTGAFQYREISVIPF